MKRNGNFTDTSRDIRNKTESGLSHQGDFYKVLSIVSCNLKRQAEQLKKSAAALRRGAKELRERVAEPGKVGPHGKGGYKGDLLHRFITIAENTERTAAIKIMVAGDIINNIYETK